MQGLPSTSTVEVRTVHLHHGRVTTLLVACSCGQATKARNPTQARQMAELHLRRTHRDTLVKEMPR